VRHLELDVTPWLGSSHRSSSLVTAWLLSVRPDVDSEDMAANSGVGEQVLYRARHVSLQVAGCLAESSVWLRHITVCTAIMKSRSQG
jgi:hypothetical protein